MVKKEETYIIRYHYYSLDAVRRLFCTLHLGAKFKDINDFVQFNNSYFQKSISIINHV